MLAKLTGDIWDFLPNSALPLLARFARDPKVVDLAVARLIHGGTPDEKATYLKVVAHSARLSPEVVEWAREELNRQLARNDLTELGCDLLGARVGPVTHSLLETLEGSA